MSFQLVIAEKPSVARSIAAVIGADEKQNGYWQGGGYLVSWCIGHLVSFAEAGQYDEKYCKWKYEDLPILPQPWHFIVPDEKKQQFEIVRSLLNRPDVDSVTAATDAGTQARRQMIPHSQGAEGEYERTLFIFSSHCQIGRAVICNPNTIPQQITRWFAIKQERSDAVFGLRQLLLLLLIHIYPQNNYPT